MPETITLNQIYDGRMQPVTVVVTSKCGFDDHDRKAIVKACVEDSLHQSKKYKGKLPAGMIGYIHGPNNTIFSVTAMAQTSTTPPSYTISIGSEGQVKAGFHCF